MLVEKSTIDATALSETPGWVRLAIASLGFVRELSVVEMWATIVGAVKQPEDGTLELQPEESVMFAADGTLAAAV